VPSALSSLGSVDLGILRAILSSQAQIVEKAHARGRARRSDWRKSHVRSPRLITLQVGLSD
jgi:hypothetical protein